MLYHIPDLEQSWIQKICPVGKGLKVKITIASESTKTGEKAPNMHTPVRRSPLAVRC